ncbi:hypothetical protein K435DRAFT_786356, partial [Dendrothele bispora CBS 962.96]
MYKVFSIVSLLFVVQGLVGGVMGQTQCTSSADGPSGKICCTNLAAPDSDGCITPIKFGVLAPFVSLD